MVKLTGISNPKRGVSVEGTYLSFDNPALPEDVAEFISTIYAKNLKARTNDNVKNAEPLVTGPRIVQPDGNYSLQQLIRRQEPHTLETYIGVNIDGGRYHPFLLISEFDSNKREYDHVLTLTNLNEEKKKKYDSLSLLNGSEKGMLNPYIGKDITSKI